MSKRCWGKHAWGKISQNYQRFDGIFSGSVYSDGYGLTRIKEFRLRKQASKTCKCDLLFVSWHYLTAEGSFTNSSYSHSTSITKFAFFFFLFWFTFMYGWVKNEEETSIYWELPGDRYFMYIGLNSHKNPLKEELIILCYHWGTRASRNSIVLKSCS